ncbi:MAG: ribonuclease III [Pseudomonadota bacterium]
MAGFLIPLTDYKTANSDAARTVEAALNYTFGDRSLLERALTHASVSGSGVKDLERLEFLGDRVLGLLTAETLWRRFPDLDEGQLAPRLNALVRKETCADAARFWAVGPALRLSTGEERNGGRDKDAILGDACEALLGAIYIDGGLGAVARAYETYWGEQFEALSARPQDAKTALQEWAQQHRHGTPKYRDLERSGPDHAPQFTIEVTVGKLTPIAAVGRNKRDAQMKAAAQFLVRERVWSND